MIRSKAKGTRRKIRRKTRKKKMDFKKIKEYTIFFDFIILV